MEDPRRILRWDRLGWLTPFLVVVAAAALRMWNLADLPEGLHGDEAWTGIDARRVLVEGWIGAYLPSALGQPAGPIYFVAALLHFLPDDIGTVRLAMAFFGTAGVLFTLLLAREHEGTPTGVFAAALLSVSLWHLHASRIGMMFVSCPVALMAGLWLVAVARRRDSLLLFAVAGIVAGSGVYSYNAYPTALPLFAVPFVYALFGARGTGVRRRWLAQSAVFCVGALIAAAPMIHYIVLHREDYLRHHHLISVLDSAAWETSAWSQRARILYDRGYSLLRGLLWEGEFDGGDGFGVGKIPVLGPLPGALAAVGVVIALVRWRRVLSGLALFAIPLISLGALLTVGAGMYRRTIALAPFVAILGALPLAALWESRAGATRARWFAAVRAAAALALTAAVAAEGIATYFGPFSHHDKFRWVFSRDLRAIGEVVAKLPENTRVYLFAERWGCGYETMRYLAPRIRCTDRSRRFGKATRRLRLLDLSVAADQPAMFILTGEHMSRQKYLDKFTELYPEAVQSVGELDGKPAFITVSLPSGAAGRIRARQLAPPRDDGDGPLSVLALEPLDVFYGFEPPRENRTWNGQPVILGGRKFARALGMHAPTEMTYAVPPRALTLRATVGLSDAVKDCARASVVFEVRDETDRLLADSGLMRGGDPPRQIEADLRGATEVTLVAFETDDGRDCDHANWANPVILRSPRAAAMAQAKPAGEPAAAASAD